MAPSETYDVGLADGSSAGNAAPVFQVHQTTSVATSASDGGDVEVVEDELIQKKQALERLCTVLGLSYSKKLSEFGSKVDVERLDEALAFLSVTIEDNFKQLKGICKEMIKEWELCNVPLKRMYKFHWLLYIKDATSASDLWGKDMLSTASVSKARRELAALKEQKANKIEKRYLSKKTKLENLLEDSHLVGRDIGFEPDKTVDRVDFSMEKRIIKRLIKQVKGEAAVRKELVLRVELARNAFDKEEWSLDDVNALIHNAEELAEAMKMRDGEVISYDGKSVDDVLSSFHKKAAAREAEEEKRAREALPGRTRGGSRYKKRDDASDPEDDEV